MIPKSIYDAGMIEIFIVKNASAEIKRGADSFFYQECDRYSCAAFNRAVYMVKRVPNNFSYNQLLTCLDSATVECFENFWSKAKLAELAEAEKFFRNKAVKSCSKQPEDPKKYNPALCVGGCADLDCCRVRQHYWIEGIKAILRDAEVRAKMEERQDPELETRRFVTNSTVNKFMLCENNEKGGQYAGI